MKNIILFSLFLILLGCNDPLEPAVTSKKIGIHAEQRGSDFLFARLPIDFYSSSYPDSYFDFPFPIKGTWTFGDGKSSDQSYAGHTFDFAGTYKVSFTSGEGPEYKDTTVVVHPPLSLIGSKKTGENGQFLFSHPVSGYTVIHTRNTGSSVEDWMALSTSAAFDSVRSAEIPFSAYSTVADAFLNNNNNLVVVNGLIWEIEHSGKVVKQAGTGGVAWTPKCGIQTTNGYQFAGWHFQGKKIHVARFNADLEKTTETDIDVTREGYYVTNFYIESEDILRLHYVKDTGRENPPRTLVRMNVSGAVLLEQSYSEDYPIGSSFQLTSGYLLAGVRTINYGSEGTYVFTKIGQAGDVEWTVTSLQENSYAQYMHSGKIRVIENNSFIYVFFDNQKGMKISSAGELIWSKRFGIEADTFNDALMNKTGNFVLLGSHQFDYRTFEYTTDYQKRDLVLTEIDQNGNIVVPR
jgi:hypothetical protein